MNPIQHGVNYPVRFGLGDKQVKLFTHTDLDGISCEIAFRISKAYETYSFDCRRIDYNEPGIKDLLKDYTGTIFVTDIKGSNEFWNQMTRNEVIVIDHHQWPEVPKHINLKLDQSICGASGTLKYLTERFGLRFDHPAVDLYFRYVNAYDMWLKKTEPKNFERGKILNHLLNTIGKDKYIEAIQQRMYADTALVTEDEVKDYERYQSSIKDRAERTVQQMVIITDDDNHKCGFAASDSTQSDVMNTILELVPEIEYLALYNRVKKTVSLRRQDASTLDLSVIAARYGGGGHQAAAGYPMSEHFVKGYRI